MCDTVSAEKARGMWILQTCRNMDIIRCMLYVLIFMLSITLSFAERKPRRVQPDELNKLLEEENYEEFGKLLKINSNVAGPPLEKEHEAEIYSQEYGDVLLRPEQINTKNPMSYNGVIVKKWNGSVPYAILPANYTTEEINLIEESIRDWNCRFADVIPFRPKKKKDRNWVCIFKGNGCLVNTGMVGGVQALSLKSYPCVQKPGWIKHEMMHVIGFMHANQRMDRDLYIRNHPERYYPGFEGIYGDIVPTVNTTEYEVVQIYGRYEYESLMHLTPYPAGIEPEPWYDVLRSNISDRKIGIYIGLTKNDMDMVRSMYKPGPVYADPC